MKPSLHPLAAALALALLAPPALADEREALESLRATTLNLINALVDSGAITRQRADELIKSAQARPAAVWGTPARPVDTPNAVRVPYVPEVVRNQIRDEVKNDVIAQAKAERWAEPNKLPGWLDRFEFYGDVRVRGQADLYADDNTAPIDYDLSLDRSSGLTTRHAELADSGRLDGNTRDSVPTLRLRARLGVIARVSESTSAEIRLASGSNNSATSTNQTLGNGLGKYSFWLDRASIDHTAAPWLSVSAGRMANPWQDSELAWDEDLNFDGIALKLRLPQRPELGAYATVGAFPLYSESQPRRPNATWLYGGQVGLAWALSADTRVKASLALYQFHNLEGIKESDSELDPVSLSPITATYGDSAYPSGLRRKGNTLFRINAPSDAGSTLWGLASRFRPVHASVGVELRQFFPTLVTVSADYLKNTAFDRTEILARTGVALGDGKDDGYQLKLTLGTPTVRYRGDWNASLAWRYLGSDVMPDGFVDSDFGLGGTNQRGFVLGGSYGLDSRTALTLRYLAAKSIDSTTMRTPTLLNPGAGRLAVDVLQADIQVRF
jgi:hypothetical protein